MTIQKSTAEIVQDLAEKQAEDEDARMINTLIELQTKVFDRATAYTNVIMFGGYAGAFAIWNFTRQILNEQAEIWVALLLTTSLTVFVFFEVFKMIITTMDFKNQRALLTKALSSEQFLVEWQQLKQRDNKKVSAVVMPIWGVVLLVSAFTALGAIGILLWSFVAILVGGPAG